MLKVCWASLDGRGPERDEHAEARREQGDQERREDYHDGRQGGVEEEMPLAVGDVDRYHAHQQAGQGQAPGVGHGGPDLAQEYGPVGQGGWRGAFRACGAPVLRRTNRRRRCS